MQQVNNEENKQVENIKQITFTGEDFTLGLWPSLSKLAQSPALEPTTKIRVASIYRDVNKLVGKFQEEYEAAVEALGWEGTGPQRKCKDPEKLKELNDQYSNREFTITGRKLKIANVEKSLSAQDLVVLSAFFEEKI